MLQLLLHTVLISLICIIWGIPAYFLLKKDEAEKYWIGNGLTFFSFLFFSGLLTISLISSWLIIFIPLTSNYFFIISTILALFFRFRYKKEINEIAKTLGPINIRFSGWSLFIFVTILLLLLLGTLKPVNPDTQLYHLQIIRWTNEYGVVPGMANIYPRLGLGSNWFNLISLFHIPSLNHQNFTFLNTSVTIWFLLWLMGKFHYYASSPESKNNRILVFFYFLVTGYFLFDWQLFRDTSNSTAYDFIVTILITFCLSYFIENILKNESRQKHSIYFFFTSISVISFKLSGASILVLIIIALINEKSTKLLFKTLILSAIILFPVLIKNHITTGYILYPSLISVDNPDWQMPANMAGYFKEYIINSNRYYNHQFGTIDTLEKNQFKWIPFWFNGILLKHKLLLGLSLTSLLLLFFNPLKSINTARLKQFIFGLWIMIAGWFFMAPDPRFAFGVLLFAAFLPLSIWYGEKLPIKIYPIIFLIFSAGVLIYAYSKSGYLIKKPVHFAYPVENDKPPFSELSIHGIPFNEPQIINQNWNNRCFFTPLPCICEKNPYLQPRGNDLSDGFIMKKPDSNFIKHYNY